MPTYAAGRRGCITSGTCRAFTEEYRQILADLFSFCTLSAHSALCASSHANPSVRE